MVKIIFMVDDDQDDREIFREAIHTCFPHVEILFAIDGKDALNILEAGTQHPDVIFLDHNMPRMSGIECLRSLKANKKTKSIPVIMYTTSGDREEEKVALMLGADQYLRKMTNFEHLCSELERLLILVAKKIKRPGELRD